MTERDLLIQTRSSIIDIHRWTTGAMQRIGLLGRSHCARGALYRAAGWDVSPLAAIACERATSVSPAIALLDAAAQSMGYRCAMELNDHAGEWMPIDPVNPGVEPDAATLLARTRAKRFTRREHHAMVLKMCDIAINMCPEPEAGLEEPSIPLVVPAPNEEPRETPTYPSTPSQPLPEPEPSEPEPDYEPDETPATPEREPVPA